MTRIKKMELLNELLELEEKNDIGNLTSRDRAEFQMWIKEALEQEPILDKIRAEIESKMESVIGHYDSTTPIYDMASYKVERNKVREECRDIIDKYRQEGQQ